MTPSRLAFIRHKLEHPEEYPANPLAVELLAYIDDLRADHESAVAEIRSIQSSWASAPLGTAEERAELATRSAIRIMRQFSQLETALREMTADRDRQRDFIAKVGLDVLALTQWQPWETVPTERKTVLAYRPDCGVLTVYPRESDDGEAIIWFTSGGEDLTGDLPTHWMPLPSGPRTESPA